jgi:predicted membrane metal-binding protein
MGKTFFRNELVRNLMLITDEWVFNDYIFIWLLVINEILFKCVLLWFCGILVEAIIGLKIKIKIKVKSFFKSIRWIFLDSIWTFSRVWKYELSHNVVHFNITINDLNNKFSMNKILRKTNSFSIKNSYKESKLYQ